MEHETYEIPSIFNVGLGALDTDVVARAIVTVWFPKSRRVLLLMAPH